MKTFKEFLSESKSGLSPKHKEILTNIIKGSKGRRNTEELIGDFYKHPEIRDDDNAPEIEPQHVDSISRELRKSGTSVKRSGRKVGEISYKQRVENAGGPEKIFKKRQEGIHDSEIFKVDVSNREGLDLLTRLREHIKKNHGDHPNYVESKTKRPMVMDKETIRTVKQHRESGLSASEIASKLEMTKNQIIGIMNRHLKENLK